MRLAVLASSQAEADGLCARIRSVRGAQAEPFSYRARDDFFRSLRSGRCRGAVIALGDSAGFLAARRLRELDKRCPVLVIDDTERYALQCVRIHVTGFLVRPVPEEKLERSLMLMVE